MVTAEEVRRKLETQINYYFKSGFYAPLFKRYTLYIDEEIPPAVKKHIDEVGTCACTEGERVFFDSAQCAKLINEARKKHPSTYFYTDDDVRTVLAHEYTHILMEHVKRGSKFVKKYGWKNYSTFALACDIEANRGYVVATDSSIYQIGVTEKAFPEVKDVVGLMNIYNTLLKKHKNDIDNEANKNENSEKGDDGGSDKTSSDSSSEASEGASDDKDDNSSSSLSNAQKDAIKNAADDLKKFKQEIEQFLENEEEEGSDSDEEETTEGKGGTSSSDENSEGEAVLEHLDPYSALRAYKHEASAKALKVAMKQLRNIVGGGNQVREKVKTYSRPARRDGEDGLMRKGTKVAKVKAPRILIAMDSSGSMDGTTMQRVTDSIGTIIDGLGRDKRGSYICEHEGYVKNVQPLSKWKEVVSRYCARGDNDFDALLREAVNLNVEVVLNIGDGCDYIRDRGLILRAKKMGLKWYDIIISENVDVKRVVDGFYTRLPRTDQYYFDRVPIDCNA